MLPSDELDGTTWGTYNTGDWTVKLRIEEADFFEKLDPPSFVLHGVLLRGGVRGGVRVGRVDVVTQIEIRGDDLHLKECHIHGMKPGELGRGGLNALAQAVMEDANVKALVVEGGTRTTGARPGHAPPSKRFTALSPSEP